MLADALVFPGIVAAIVGILSWNARAGLTAGALAFLAEVGAAAYLLLR